MRRLNKRQGGFTILELLIATTAFSVIFLGATTALVQIGKLYYKGVVTTRTQEATRSTVDQISQQLQFSADTLSPKVTLGYDVPDLNGTLGPKLVFGAYCVGSTRYSFKVNIQVDGETTAGRFDNQNLKLQHALWRDTIPSGIAGCVPANLSLKDPSTTPGALGTSGQELLGQHMRLSQFNMDCPANSNNTCNVAVGIIYGDNDLLEPVPNLSDPFAAANVPTHCGTVVADQWCAASQLTTVVLRRVAN